MSMKQEANDIHSLEDVTTASHTLMAHNILLNEHYLYLNALILS